MGPGPFTPEDQINYNKLKEVLQKARERQDTIFQSQQQNPQNRSVTIPAQNIQLQQQTLTIQPHQQIHINQPQMVTHVPQQDQQQQQQQRQQQLLQQQQEQQRQQQLLQQQQQQEQQRQRQQQQQQQQQHATTSSQAQSTQSTYASSSQSSQQQQQQQLQQQSAQLQSQVLDKRALQELVKEIDPTEQLDEDVEDILLQIADDFIDNVINGSCQIAKHRKSNILETKDVQFHLERNWNIWIPGFGSDELKTFKKSYSTEAHKQRIQLIKKSNKTVDTKDKSKE